MLRADLFAEDQAHELFISALINRVMEEAGTSVSISVRSAVGGHGRAISELKIYQRAVQKNLPGLSPPDLLVVAIDANCIGAAARKAEISRELVDNAAGTVALACPDPHIERWFFSDPDVFQHVVGVTLQPGRRKCVRDEYKNMLRNAVLQAGHFSTLGGLEFAQELVSAMDFYRASKNEPSLGSLIDDLKTFAKQAPKPEGE